MPLVWKLTPQVLRLRGQFPGPVPRRLQNLVLLSISNTNKKMKNQLTREWIMGQKTCKPGNARASKTWIMRVIHGQPIRGQRDRLVRVQFSPRVFVLLQQPIIHHASTICYQATCELYIFSIIGCPAGTLFGRGAARCGCAVMFFLM